MPDYTPARYRAAVLPFQQVGTDPTTNSPSVSPTWKMRVLKWLVLYYDSKPVHYSVNTVIVLGFLLFAGWPIYTNHRDMQILQAAVAKVRPAYPVLQQHFSAPECEHEIRDLFYVLACNHQMTKKALTTNNAGPALDYLEKLNSELEQRGYDD